MFIVVFPGIEGGRLEKGHLSPEHFNHSYALPRLELALSRSLQSCPLRLLLLLQLLQQTCPGQATSMERIKFGLLLNRKYLYFVMGN